MDVASLVVQITTAAVLAATLIAVIIYTQRTSDMANATQKLAETGQEQVEVSLRPFLYPDYELVVETDANTGTYFNFDQLDGVAAQLILLKNAGAGIALNIRGVLMQPRPRQESDLAIVPRIRSIALDALPSGAEKYVRSTAGPFAFDWNTYIGDDPHDTFVAPDNVVARLTLTYDGTSGQTHGCQFDYTDQSRWVFHKFYPKIARDIEALGHESDLLRGAAQAAFRKELAAGRTGGSGE